MIGGTSPKPREPGRRGPGSRHVQAQPVRLWTFCRRVRARVSRSSATRNASAISSSCGRFRIVSSMTLSPSTYWRAKSWTTFSSSNDARYGAKYSPTWTCRPSFVRCRRNLKVPRVWCVQMIWVLVNRATVTFQASVGPARTGTTIATCRPGRTQVGRSSYSLLISLPSGSDAGVDLQVGQGLLLGLLHGLGLAVQRAPELRPRRVLGLAYRDVPVHVLGDRVERRPCRLAHVGLRVGHVEQVQQGRGLLVPPLLLGLARLVA